jgi:hypothetical protein
MAIAVTATATGCGSSGSKSDGGGLGNDGGGGPSGVASCTISESLGTAVIKLCDEVSGPADAVAAIQQSCTAPAADAGVSVQANFQNGPCSHAGALGGCRVTDNAAVVTIWYYDDGSGLQTPADIQMLCAADGATYVAP